MSNLLVRAIDILGQIEGTEPNVLIPNAINPTVVEYAVQEMVKGKSPKAAANATVRKLSGKTNLFLGPGIKA